MIDEMSSSSASSDARIIRRSDVGDRVLPAFPASPLLKEKIAEAHEICAGRDSILKQAAAKSQEIIEAARAESDTIREAAGQEARAQALAECQAQLAGLIEAHQRLDETYAESVEHAALQIAKAAIDVELKFERGIIAALVRQLIDSAHRYRRLTVCVHPDEVGGLKSSEEALRQRAAFAEAFEIQADPRIPLGRVVLKTEMGDYATSIGERIAAIQDQLAAARSQGGEP